MSAQVTEELKACPFCGGKPSYDREPWPNNIIFSIWCEDCKVGVDHSVTDETDLVAVWNRRSSLPESGEAVAYKGRTLAESDVQWVVNDNAELGVKIGWQFFFCYKGESFVYETGKHDDGSQMLWRQVLKREFGECIHPVNYANPMMIGAVSVNDGNEWHAVPPASPVHDQGEVERLRKALRRIDAFWTEDFPDGPDGDRTWGKGLGKLSDETVEVWREIRAALEGK